MWRTAVVRAFGEPERILIEQRSALPKLTSPKQALIRVKCAGVNPLDTYIRAGQYSVLPQLPYTPGREGSGIIEQIGDEVKDFKVGDRVWFMYPSPGGCADYTTADTFFKLNDATSFAEGATLGIKYMTAYRALFLKAKAKAGQTVLIDGASGGVGLAAVQLAAAANLKVVGTASTAEGRGLVRDNGAELVVDHSQRDHWDELREKYPHGFDIIIEMLANANLNDDFSVIADNGCIVVVGSRGTVEVNPRLLMGKEACVRGVLLARATSQELAYTGTQLSNMLRENKIKPVISERFALNQLPEAHRHLVAHTGAHGSVIVDMDLE